MSEYEPKPNEILITQYIRPYGHKRVVFAPCDEPELVEAAKDMAISVEVDSLNNVIIYCHHKDEPEESEWIEICPNGPQVHEALKRAIRKKLQTPPA